MNKHDRLLRIAHVKHKDQIVASDLRGRIHLFDRELNLIRSSPSTSYLRPINALAVTEKYVFTRDRVGTVGKWDVDTLQPLDFYDDVYLRKEEGLLEGEEPSPTAARGIAVVNGKVYTNNGYGQIVELDAETFEVLAIRDSPSHTFFDVFCADDPELHAVGDIEGNVYIGNLERNEWPTKIQVDTSVVHGLCYDRRHDRFWSTQDGGLGDDKFLSTGVTTFEKDGSGFAEYKFAHEDNEFMQFNEDHTKMYVGGFDALIHVFDNTDREMRELRTLGPLPFQVIHGFVASDEAIYVLLQTGIIMCLNSRGDIVHRLDFENKCIWMIEAHPVDDSLFYLATDRGVETVRVTTGLHGSIHVTRLDKHEYDFGTVKDARPLPDGSFVAIGRKGVVFRADQQGRLMWSRKMAGFPRTVALNDDFTRALAGSDSGEAVEYDVADGREIDRFQLDSAVYACAYAPDGRRLLAVFRNMSVHVYAGDSQERLAVIPFNLRLKRFLKKDGVIFTIGGDGLVELDLDNYCWKGDYNELVANTKENAAILDDTVHLGGYGYQIGSYRRADGEIIDLKEYLQDFTKAFAARIGEDGVPILLVGGRSAFLNAYRVVNGVPQKVREIYL